MKYNIRHSLLQMLAKSGFLKISMSLIMAVCRGLPFLLIRVIKEKLRLTFFFFFAQYFIYNINRANINQFFATSFSTIFF